MKPIQYPPVYVGAYVLLVTAVLSVVNLEATLPAAFLNLLIWAVVYGIGLVCGWHYREKKNRLFERVGYFLVCVAFLVFVVDYSSLGLAEAFLGFLIWIQAAQNFTLSDRKGLFYTYVVSLILILYAASASKEATFLVYLVVYVLAGTFTLMADHVDETLGRAEGGDKAILLNRMQLPVKGGAAALATMSLALLFYLFFPRPPSPHLHAFPVGGGWYYRNTDWEKQADTGESARSEVEEDRGTDRNPDSNGEEGRAGEMADYSGFRKKFDITEMGVRALSNDVVFYLQADRPIYARGKVFDHFDGRIWEESGVENTKIASEETEFAIEKDARGNGTGQVYTIKSDLSNLIFAGYRPSTLWFPASVIEKEADLSLRSPDLLRKGTVYSVRSQIEEIDGRPYAGGADDPATDRYLQLPPDLPERIGELSRSATEDARGAYQKAVALETFLKKTYPYTLATAFERPEGNPIDYFLFDRKEGHCEYFASSMVVMLRTIGIPSRLTTGYAATQYNPFTGYIEVRRLNAHAWVEAYIDGYGWVTFEPTPGFDLPRAAHRYFAVFSLLRYAKERTEAAIQADPEGWRGRIFQRLLALLKATLGFFKGILATVLEVVGAFWVWMKEIGWLLLLGFSLAAGLLYGIWRSLPPAVRQRRLKAIKERDPRRFVFECYLEMERMLSRKGAPRPASLSPVEYKAVLSTRYKDLMPQIGAIIGSFDRARYGAFPVGSKEVEEAYRAYEDLRSMMHRRTNPV